MLINKGSETVTIRYNGVEKTLSPKQKIDVRDFDVENKAVKAVEKHLMSKWPGRFEQIVTVEDAKIAAEYDGKIEGLEKENEQLKKHLAELKASRDQMQEKFGAGVEEVKAAKKEAESLRKDVTRLEKENDDLEDEVKKLRAESRKGK